MGDTVWLWKHWNWHREERCDVPAPVGGNDITRHTQAWGWKLSSAALHSVTAFPRGEKSYVYIGKSCSMVGLQSKTSGIEDPASTPHTLREKEVISARFWSGLVACLLRRCLPLWLHLQWTCPMQRETALQCKSKCIKRKGSGNPLQKPMPCQVKICCRCMGCVLSVLHFLESSVHPQQKHQAPGSKESENGDQVYVVKCVLCQYNY